MEGIYDMSCETLRRDAPDLAARRTLKYSLPEELAKRNWQNG